MTRKFRPEAVVFDKDGVLADSEWINVRSAREIFAAHGHELGPSDDVDIVGKHPLDYVPLLAARFGIDKTEQRRMIDEQERIYYRLWRDEGRLLDGAREALDAARKMGFPVGMATSSSRREVDEFLERFDLARCFEVVLTLDDVTRSKPDPEIYLLAARQLDVAPSEMLVVEDSAFGIAAAKAAGAVCVALRTAQAQAQVEGTSSADARIHSLHELAQLLGSKP
jgi:HAD superfamily hydrolase (TIGR01509 family)